MFCTKCGSKKRDGAKFCYTCGSSVDQEFDSSVQSVQEMMCSPEVKKIYNYIREPAITHAL
jgi:uncharacterized membrane protein YvbJ